MATIEKEKHIYDLVGGTLSLDFVNTRSNYTDKHTPTNDYFSSYNDLLNWAQQVAIITPAQEQKLAAIAAASPHQANMTLDKAKNLRTAIQRTLTAAGQGQTPDPLAFKLFNSELAVAMTHTLIARSSEGYEWNWQPAPTNLESILWPIIKSAADLLVSNKIARVHECAGDTCGWMFIDTSKNHSRRWCDMKDCGNTAKARRHYQKVKSSDEKPILQA